MYSGTLDTAFQTMYNASMKKRNLIILDFDGVINASKYAYAVKTDNYWGGNYEKATLFIDSAGFDVYYSPELVDTINTWARRGDTDIVWVTTWFGNTDQFSKLGFDAFPEAGPEYSDDVPYGHRWKSRIGAELIEQGNYEKCVWIDDDVTVNGPYKKWPSQVQDRFIRVNPMGYFGMTREDTDLIEKYLDFLE